MYIMEGGSRPMTQEQSSKRSIEFLDTLSVPQLRQLLRAEFESDGADVELIRNITTVLASKEDVNQQDIDVDAAYKTFVDDYSQTEPLFGEVFDEMDDSEAQKTTEPSRKNTTARIAICIAAVIALLVGATLTAGAFGFNLWGWLTRWTDNDFRFVPAKTASTETVSNDYTDIPSALAALGITEPLYPTWIPEGYEVYETVINTSPPIKVIATYLCTGNSTGLVIHITETKNIDYESIYEKDHMPLMQYNNGNNLHYIFKNYENYTAVWHTSDYEVTITGNISLDEMMKIIDSIYEEV